MRNAIFVANWNAQEIWWLSCNSDRWNLICEFKQRKFYLCVFRFFLSSSSNRLTRRHMFYVASFKSLLVFFRSKSREPAVPGCMQTVIIVSHRVQVCVLDYIKSIVSVSIRRLFIISEYSLTSAISSFESLVVASTKNFDMIICFGILMAAVSFVILQWALHIFTWSIYYPHILLVVLDMYLYMASYMVVSIVFFTLVLVQLPSIEGRCCSFHLQ